MYVSSEEYGSATLSEKVKDLLNPFPPTLHFARDINAFDIANYDVVVLDSVNDLGLELEDFKALKANNPNTAFILVLQHIKSGDFRGGKEWEHEAQIAGTVSNGVIEIYKNRFGPKGTMNFFEN